MNFNNLQITSTRLHIAEAMNIHATATRNIHATATMSVPTTATMSIYAHGTLHGLLLFLTKAVFRIEGVRLLFVSEDAHKDN